jgi:hypothetical protein
MLEEVLLDAKVLDDRFDDEIATAQFRHARAGMKSRESVRGSFGREESLLDHASHVRSDTFEAPAEDSIVHIIDEDIDVRENGEAGDTGAHGASANDSEMFEHARFFCGGNGFSRNPSRESPKLPICLR